MKHTHLFFKLIKHKNKAISFAFYNKTHSFYCEIKQDLNLIDNSHYLNNLDFKEFETYHNNSLSNLKIKDDIEVIIKELNHWLSQFNNVKVVFENLEFLCFKKRVFFNTVKHESIESLLLKNNYDLDYPLILISDADTQKPFDNALDDAKVIQNVFFKLSKEIS